MHFLLSGGDSRAGAEVVRKMINLQDAGFSRACISDRYYLLKASRVFMTEGPIALYVYDREKKKSYHIDESLDLKNINESYHPSRIYYREGLINMEDAIAYINESGSIDFGRSAVLYGLKYQFDLSDGRLRGTKIAPERLRRR